MIGPDLRYRHVEKIGEGGRGDSEHVVASTLDGWRVAEIDSRLQLMENDEGW